MEDTQRCAVECRGANAYASVARHRFNKRLAGRSREWRCEEDWLGKGGAWESKPKETNCVRESKADEEGMGSPQGGRRALRSLGLHSGATIPRPVQRNQPRGAKDLTIVIRPDLSSVWNMIPQKQAGLQPGHSERRAPPLADRPTTDRLPQKNLRRALVLQFTPAYTAQTFGSPSGSSRPRFTFPGTYPRGRSLSRPAPFLQPHAARR
jgi:hypothetical protein